MHWRVILGKVHTRHHKDGHGDGFLLEWLSYLAGAVPAAAAIAALGWWVGEAALAAGAAAGALAYATFAAYAHQLQHDRPELVFWMRMPVHYVHHRQQQWRANFGIGVDVWDRILGTYQPVDWSPEPLRRLRAHDFFRIKWM